VTASKWWLLLPWQTLVNTRQSDTPHMRLRKHKM
jgi:hypothetical protein